MRIFSHAFGALLAMVSGPSLAEEAVQRPPVDSDGTYTGMAFPWQMNFQEAVTPVMERLYGLHEFLLIVITIISLFVLGLLGYACIRYRKKNNPVASKNSHNTVIEVIWTVVPIFILAAIFIPSYRLHYDCMHSIGCSEDGTPVEPDMTLKVVGYQWYWNYEYPGTDIIFDSYMKKSHDAEGNELPMDHPLRLQPGEPRLLAVDYPVVVPVNANVRVLVTGGDVIHSWAMPAFGVKQDTVPGRLNETWFRAEKEGTYYGQCSELCGIRHGFMPIQVEVVSQEMYDEWLEVAKQDIDKASKLIAAHRGRLPSDKPAQLAESTQGVQ